MMGELSEPAQFAHSGRGAAIPATRKLLKRWLRGVDLNHRPLGYEPNELPDCSTPHFDHSNRGEGRQTLLRRNRSALKGFGSNGSVILTIAALVPSMPNNVHKTAASNRRPRHPNGMLCLCRTHALSEFVQFS